MILKVVKLSKFLLSLQLLLPLKKNLLVLINTLHSKSKRVIYTKKLCDDCKFEYNNYERDFLLAPIHPDFHHFRGRFGYTGHQRIITVFSVNEIELLYLLC